MSGTTRECEAGMSTLDWDLDFREICWQSSAAIWVIEADEIIYANPALAKLLQTDLAAIVGYPPEEYIHEDDRSWFRQQTPQGEQENAESIPRELRLVRPSGSELTVEVRESRLASQVGFLRLGTMLETAASRQSDSTVKERIGFEQLLAELSAAFINLPASGIDNHINDSLRRLVEFLGNDRSTLVEFGDDDSHVLVTHSQATPGSDALRLGAFPVERLPWYIGQFRQGRSVFLRDTAADLPQAASREREYCLANGIQSNVTVPLMAGGHVIGGLIFAFIRQRCTWPVEMLVRLKLVGEVFANALIRKRTEESLQQALAENEHLRQKLEQENLHLRQQTVPKHTHGRIVSQSDAMARVLSSAEQVAPTDAPVLLLGETGTGKELLAQAIHEMSNRQRRRMVIVNCASLPATLVESELFGRAEGAYTGAASAQAGRFELAHESTLFLDEVGELPHELQAKLLRVLQDGRFERLGSSTTISVDVRLIAATNRNLEQAMREHEFRTDLYHRLNVFPIQLPPLRERREDIPPLVWTFVEQFGNRMGKAIKSIPRRAMEQLQQYHWPGNVRELSNVIERAMILTTDDVLQVEPLAARQQPEMVPCHLQESQKQEILRVLTLTGWRIRGEGGAAERLGLKPTTLEARMLRLGIKRPRTH
jgi:formate hydrogenlyase transcriptional activator